MARPPGIAGLLPGRTRPEGVYWLELAGEDDAFAAAEAATGAAGVELAAPGIARAGGLRPDGVRRLAYTRTAADAVGRADPDVDAAAALLRATALDRAGSVAVRARDVRGTAGVSTACAERVLGGVLVDRGFTVDLDDPDHVLRALFAAGTVVDHDAVPGADGDERDLAALGWVAARGRRGFSRAPTDRPFFQPGSMPPTDARAVVNLAGAGPGRQLLDPMCGTGGLLLEAAQVGGQPVGVDAQGKMVAGSRRNLRAAGGRTDGKAGTEAAGDAPEPVFLRGDATALPLRTGAVDAVALDAPYGRQSKVAGHDLDDLIAGTLAEARRVGGERAVAVADRPWRGAVRTAGWRLDGLFARRVHASLTRYIHILAEPER